MNIFESIDKLVREMDNETFERQVSQWREMRTRTAAAEGAGTVCPCGCGVKVPPTAAAAVPAGGDAFDRFFYSALDPRPEPARLDGKVLPLGTAVLYGACGGDADKFWLATMRKAFEAGQAAPAPRGGVTEASGISHWWLAQQSRYGYASMLLDGPHKDAAGAQKAYDLCGRLSLFNGFTFCLVRAEQWEIGATPPAAQAQDTGPK